MFPHCPKCNNSLQNVVISPNSRRCANCKTVFDVYMLFIHTREYGLINISYESVKHYYFSIGTQDIIDAPIGTWWALGETIIMKVKYDNG